MTKTAVAVSTVNLVFGKVRCGQHNTLPPAVSLPTDRIANRLYHFSQTHCRQLVDACSRPPEEVPVAIDKGSG
jgi:hypothetical protein